MGSGRERRLRVGERSSFDDAAERSRYRIECPGFDVARRRGPPPRRIVHSGGEDRCLAGNAERRRRARRVCKEGRCDVAAFGARPAAGPRSLERSFRSLPGVSAAYLFPGQGAQTPGFLHRLPAHPIVKQTSDEAAQALGMDLLALDTAEALLSTKNVQLSVLVAGVAVTRALAYEGMRVDAAAGLSVGAFGAAVACGALGFADALALVKIRGECMEQAYPKGYGMAAIAGLDERQVAAILEQVGGAYPEVYLANIKTPSQFVGSGAEPALEAAMKVARE